MLLIRKKALRGCKVFYLDFCKDTLSAADVWGVLGASSAFLGAASLPCARRLLFCARYQPLYERIVSFTRVSLRARRDCFPSCGLLFCALFRPLCAFPSFEFALFLFVRRLIFFARVNFPFMRHSISLRAIFLPLRASLSSHTT